VQGCRFTTPSQYAGIIVLSMGGWDTHSSALYVSIPNTCDISIYTFILHQFDSSLPLFSLFLLPLLKMTSTGFSIQYSCMYKKYLKHFTSLNMA
jgi:hypothetical protein